MKRSTIFLGSIVAASSIHASLPAAPKVAAFLKDVYSAKSAVCDQNECVVTDPKKVIETDDGTTKMKADKFILKFPSDLSVRFPTDYSAQALKSKIEKACESAAADQRGACVENITADAQNRLLISLIIQSNGFEIDNLETSTNGKKSLSMGKFTLGLKVPAIKIMSKLNNKVIPSDLENELKISAQNIVSYGENNYTENSMKGVTMMLPSPASYPALSSKVTAANQAVTKTYQRLLKETNQNKVDYINADVKLKALNDKDMEVFLSLSTKDADSKFDISTDLVVKDVPTLATIPGSGTPPQMALMMAAQSIIPKEVNIVLDSTPLVNTSKALAAKDASYAFLLKDAKAKVADLSSNDTLAKQYRVLSLEEPRTEITIKNKNNSNLITILGTKGGIQNVLDIKISK